MKIAGASWLREPFVHFVLLGVLVFLVMGWRGGDDGGDAQIRVTLEDQGRLVANFASLWNRPPDADEVQALIDEHVREEIWYREALRMGMDRNDSVIRRHLRGRMEFLAGTSAEADKPDDATLGSFMTAHAGRYGDGPLLSFDQIYLGQDGEALDAAVIRTRLGDGADWRTLGKRLSLPASLRDADAVQIDRQFGGGFARDLAALPGDGWGGPVRSGFGQHLVRITARKPGAPPDLAKIRDRVEQDWRSAHMREAVANAYAEARERYQVTIER
ncbi:MAG: peptidylprolyl isomerase [Blastomonas sp.]